MNLFYTFICILFIDYSKLLLLMNSRDLFCKHDSDSQAGEENKGYGNCRARKQSHRSAAGRR